LPADGDPSALRAALGELGLICDVEVAGGLAILVPRAGASAVTRAVRTEVARLGRACGFTHVALEIEPAEAGDPPAPHTVHANAHAALPRD
jgi:hypothetical protein